MTWGESKKVRVSGRFELSGFNCIVIRCLSFIINQIFDPKFLLRYHTCIHFIFVAQRAKELCASAARAAKEAEQTAEMQLNQPTIGLSVEAVAALGAASGPAASTAGSVTGAQSFLGKDRKTSTIAGPRGGGAGKNIPQLQQSPPGTPPQAAPLGRKLSVSASVAGEDGLYSCLLPEDLLVELLAERFQVCSFV